MICQGARMCTGLPRILLPADSARTPGNEHPTPRFPMQVFGVIHDRLLQQGIITPSQLHSPPALPSDAELALVHTPEYLAAFSGLTLDEARARR